MDRIGDLTLTRIPFRQLDEPGALFPVVRTMQAELLHQSLDDGIALRRFLSKVALGAPLHALRVRAQTDRRAENSLSPHNSLQAHLLLLMVGVLITAGAADRSMVFWMLPFMLGRVVPNSDPALLEQFRGGSSPQARGTPPSLERGKNHDRHYLSQALFVCCRSSGRPVYILPVAAFT